MDAHRTAEPSSLSKAELALCEAALAGGALKPKPWSPAVVHVPEARLTQPGGACAAVGNVPYASYIPVKASGGSQTGRRAARRSTAVSYPIRIPIAAEASRAPTTAVLNRASNVSESAHKRARS